MKKMIFVLGFVLSIFSFSNAQQAPGEGGTLCFYDYTDACGRYHIYFVRLPENKQCKDKNTRNAREAFKAMVNQECEYMRQRQSSFTQLV